MAAPETTEQKGVGDLIEATMKMARQAETAHEQLEDFFENNAGSRIRIKIRPGQVLAINDVESGRLPEWVDQQEPEAGWLMLEGILVRFRGQVYDKADTEEFENIIGFVNVRFDLHPDTICNVWLNSAGEDLSLELLEDEAEQPQRTIT